MAAWICAAGLLATSATALRDRRVPLAELVPAAARRLADAGVPAAEAAARTGYADQPHLSREVRALAGVPLGQLLAGSGANRATPLPSGSRTMA
ncbi:hypothetical protein [Pseudonocardia asaccharolytica]|uniref:HTH araC/xylS-type domain-containing protein n=1 Tax=Pseudonocardia asaccharolytica DSM 44247 = NBRC 16224 TaxID=1123024 RepID=A0A511D4E7_9PSEU|nr:hypothetical protein [Pseudonocardia asaccharolytica]GEL19666.1 hypothetical protein PA7_35030 [Pseudonocardia asaccharolytica DSM 44247 = NBRC 16224]